MKALEEQAEAGAEAMDESEEMRARVEVLEAAVASNGKKVKKEKK